MATVNLGRIKFVWQGAYSGATAYVADDVVSYNGSSYICILASTNNLPTNATYWNLMAQTGTDITSIAGLAQGDVLYYNGTSWVRLGAGTSGQFLKTNGSGANPAWATVSSDFVKLSSTNITSSVASVDIDGFFDDTTYGGYVVYANGIELSAATDIRLRVRQSNTLITSGNYGYIMNYSYWSSATSANSLGVSRTATSIRMFDWDRKDSNTIANFHFHFSRPTVAGLTKNFHGQYYSNGQASNTYWSSPNTFGGEFEGNTNALSGITIFATTGNMTAGSIVMYGLKK